MDELKQVEDLKAECKSLDDKYWAKVETERKHAIEKAKKDFESFFVSKGFKKSPEPYYPAADNITVNYGEMSAVLTFDPYDTPLMGVSYRFDLSLSLGSSQKFIVCLVRKENRIPSVPDNVSKYSLGEILSLIHGRIDSLKELLDKGDLDSFSFRVGLDTRRNQFDSSQGIVFENYSSMGEFLSHICES
ncbi:MAG: hypothetical protein LBC56_05595 [Oscillospiraceae bacterium]|nr:hypothetical protein [Oscillospiraceae bacterium]